MSSVRTLCEICGRIPVVQCVGESVKPTEREKLSQALIHVARLCNQSCALVAALVRCELGAGLKESHSGGEHGVSLRGNSLAVRVQSELSKVLGKSYLKYAFSDVVGKVLTKHKLDFRVDRNRLRSEFGATEAAALDRQIASNRQRLRKYVTEALGRLTSKSCLAQIPREIRAIGYTIAVVSREHAEDNFFPLVAGFLILRVVNPAFVDPEAYGLLPRTVKEVSPMARQNLICLSRVLQKLGNETLFGSDDELFCMNEFLEQNRNKMRAFLLEFCKDPEAREGAIPWAAELYLRRRDAPFVLDNSIVPDMSLLNLLHSLLWHHCYSILPKLQASAVEQMNLVRAQNKKSLLLAEDAPTCADAAWLLRTLVTLGKPQDAEEPKKLCPDDLPRWVVTHVADEVAGCAPQPRVGQSVNTWRNYLVMFGGKGEKNQVLEDSCVYLFDIASPAWRKVACRICPPPRFQHASVVCGDRLFIFGGGTGRGNLDDLWAFDLVLHQWIQITPSTDLNQFVASTTSQGKTQEETVPAAAAAAATPAVADGVSTASDASKPVSKSPRETLIHAQVHPSQWNLQESATSKVVVKKPVARFGHSLVAVDDQRLLLFGGHDGSMMKHDVFGLDLGVMDAKKGSAIWRSFHNGSSSSTPLPPGLDIPAPSARSMHSAVVYDGKMWIFGGREADGSPCSSDLHVWDIEGCRWTSLPSATKGKAPQPRWSHRAVVLKDEMMVFGGVDATQVFDVKTVHVYQFESNTWKTVTCSGAEDSHCHGHSAAVAKNLIFSVFGSASSTKHTDFLRDVVVRELRFELVTPPLEQNATDVARALFNNKRLSDIRFVVEGHTFYAHRVVFALKGCDNLLELAGDEDECQITSVSWVKFAQLLLAIYTDGSGCVGLSSLSSTLELLHQFGLQSAPLVGILIRKLVHFIDKDAAAVYHIAKDLHLRGLTVLCLSYFQQHPEMCLDKTGMSKLPFKYLQDVTEMWVVDSNQKSGLHLDLSSKTLESNISTSSL